MTLTFESAQVRPERRAAFEALVHTLFASRRLAYVSPYEQKWMRAELVQDLRRRNAVYRALSTPMTGPLPFALGYLRATPEGVVEPVADRVPDANPEVCARLLSVYLRPGAVLRFAPTPDADAEDEAERLTAPVAFRVAGEDEVERVGR